MGAVDAGIYAKDGFVDHPEDVVMLCKEFMHSKACLQAPVLFLPASLGTTLHVAGPSDVVPPKSLGAEASKERAWSAATFHPVIVFLESGRQRNKHTTRSKNPKHKTQSLSWQRP